MILRARSRSSVNGHQLTFFRIAITAFQIKVLQGNFEPEWSTKWDAALTRVDPDVRDYLNVFHARAMARATNHLVFGSPVLLLLVACTIILLGIKQGWHNLRELFARAPETTLSHVVDTRIIENEAAAYAAA